MVSPQLSAGSGFDFAGLRPHEEPLANGRCYSPGHTGRFLARKKAIPSQLFKFHLEIILSIENAPKGEEHFTPSPIGEVRRKGRIRQFPAAALLGVTQTLADATIVG